ncbi:MAG: SCO family protein [Xanthomonadales bacterium]|nr:SCO family protein [Xanthomonadales bacterium]
MRTPPRAWRWAALLSLLAACACTPQADWHGTDVTGVLPDLEFELTNERGEPVSADDFRGRPSLLFFGFTNCPGICPATLGHLKVAIDALGSEGERLQVLLATVDPARDTPEALQAYTRRFGPWLHGLTGPEAELRRLNQAYKVDFANLPGDPGGDYEVMHSGVVFAFDEAGRCRVLIRDTANTQALVADLDRLLNAPPPVSVQG